MPTISKFYGIKIIMIAGDHNPPHFHAWHGEFKASFDLRKMAFTEGELPGKEAALVAAWAYLHKDELAENFTLCSKGINPKPITPLKIKK